MRTDRSKNDFTTNMVVSLKDEKWLTHQRIAGRIASDVLIALEKEVDNRTQLSMIDLNAMAEEMITKAGGIATFKGYGKPPFPAGVCISVNKQLVHGIPTDYKLQQGDVVSFDLGVTIEGAIADTAITCIYGDKEQISGVIQYTVLKTKMALEAGIKAIKVGNRLGCIGQAIHKVARGPGGPNGVISNYGGHGLDWNVPHASPFVSNKSIDSEGIRIQPGLTIAIEPMLVSGNDVTTTTGEDGWTVYTREIGAHFEHTIFVHEDKVEVITRRSNETYSTEESKL
jgi:methionyl aminopeptidase